jgi:hypothetical protein
VACRTRLEGNSNREWIRLRQAYGATGSESTRPFVACRAVCLEEADPFAVGFFLKLLFQLEVEESADRVGGLRIVSDEVISKRWRRIKNVVYPKRNFAAC